MQQKKETKKLTAKKAPWCLRDSCHSAGEPLGLGWLGFDNKGSNTWVGTDDVTQCIVG